jgi:hypothetical protein
MVEAVCRCGKRTEVPGEPAGAAITCPACGEPIDVSPFESQSPVPSPLPRRKPIGNPAAALAIVVSMGVLAAGWVWLVATDQNAEPLWRPAPPESSTIEGTVKLTVDGQTGVPIESLAVFLLRSQVMTGDVRTDLVKVREAATARRDLKASERASVDGSVQPHRESRITEENRRRRLADATKASASAKTYASRPDAEPFDVATLHGLIRSSSLRDPVATIVDDASWSALVSRLSVQDTSSDREGDFQFPHVRPGQYYVYALHRDDSLIAEWLVPVSIDLEPIRCELNDQNATTIVARSKR